MAEFLDTVKRAAAAENRAEQVTAITPGLQQGRGDAIACRRRFPRHRARARAERAQLPQGDGVRSEEHTSELQSLMRISYAVFCLKKKTKKRNKSTRTYQT